MRSSYDFPPSITSGVGPRGPDPETGPVPLAFSTSTQTLLAFARRYDRISAISPALAGSITMSFAASPGNWTETYAFPSASWSGHVIATTSVTCCFEGGTAVAVHSSCPLSQSFSIFQISSPCEACSTSGVDASSSISLINFCSSGEHVNHTSFENHSGGSSSSSPSSIRLS